MAQANGEGLKLTEAAFVSFLQTNINPALPRSREGVDVGKILYNCLNYLNTLPFPTATTAPDNGLSLTQFARSLA
jgi:hypothetical protein